MDREGGSKGDLATTRFLVFVGMPPSLISVLLTENLPCFNLINLRGPMYDAELYDPLEEGDELPIISCCLPIKNPGFTPTKNLAYIMEAAAKIIEAKSKVSSIGTPKDQQSDKRRMWIRRPVISQGFYGFRKRHSNSLRNKGKSVPIAAQAQSPMIKEKTGPPLEKTYNVLQQNNLKQNSVPNKGRSTLKNSVSNQQGNKTQSTSGSEGQYRTVNKNVVKPECMPRKICSVLMDSEKEKKKEYGNMNMAMDNRKNGMDVVSFMFSSPIKRAMPSYQSSGQMSDKFNNSAIDSFGSNDHPSFRSSTSYLPGLNVVGASTSSARLDQMLQIAQDKDKSDSLGYFDCVLVEKSQLAMNQKWQMQVLIIGFSCRTRSMCANYCQHLFFNFPILTRSLTNGNQKRWKCKAVAAITVKLEKNLSVNVLAQFQFSNPSFASGSCSYLNGSSHCSTNESVEMEGETELSDSASSISIVDVVRKYTTRTCSTTELKELSDWELDFIRDILNSAEVNLKGFALDQTSKVINPSLFDLLENQDRVWKVMK
ncbi:hypothetical protein NC652_030543 [Populus alba x Populus x berolinensis]|nr:hypothetical protein NC652_030543 [Populus alba x Populus x berolinensis]